MNWQELKVTYFSTPTQDKIFFAIASFLCVIAMGILLSAVLLIQNADKYCNNRLQDILNSTIIMPKIEGCEVPMVSCNPLYPNPKTNEYLIFDNLTKQEMINRFNVSK